MKYFCVFVFTIVSFSGTEQFRSDYSFNQEVNGWLKLHDVPDEWQEARLMCQLEGAMLASPTDGNLLHVMQTLMRRQSNAPKSIYTGIHSTFAKGHFFSLDGLPLASMPASWAPDEPNNVNGNEDCLILHPNGTLADEDCSSVHPYVCYKKWTEDMPTMNECGTIDREYHYNNITGSCYKFHTVARSWKRAFMTCAAEGGYLAIVNSPEEAEIFKAIHLEKLPQTTTTNMHKRISFLGFRFWQQHGTWMTIHGQTLKEAGYDHWAGGEPNNHKNEENSYEGEYCGSIDAGCDQVGLNDLWCKHENPFFCEKEPATVDKNGPIPTTISPLLLNTIASDQ